MINLEIKENLEKQGYRIVGNHSAIKICWWCKKSIKDEGVCYKNTFYGIKPWRCVQMTPALPFCGHRCKFCWRDIEFTSSKWHGPIDKPVDIVEGCIKSQREILQGFGGNLKTNKKRFEESMNPLHFAISLSGEPTLYSKLPELINEIHDKNMTTFLVTNGTNPGMLKKLVEKQPTQLYVTLPAPDKEIYKKTCNPLIKDSWEKIQESLALLSKFKRSTIRLTLAKSLNMIHPEQYAELLENLDVNFVELKAFMVVGYSQYRMNYEDMPRHHEIMDFAEKICKNSSYKIIDEKKESRVVLLMKKDFKERIMKF